MSIPVAGFLIFNAKSTYEYSNSFYVLISMIAITIQVTIFYHKVGAIRNLIGIYEKFVEKRKRRFDEVENFTYCDKLDWNVFHWN